MIPMIPLRALYRASWGLLGASWERPRRPPREARVQIRCSLAPNKTNLAQVLVQQCLDRSFPKAYDKHKYVINPSQQCANKSCQGEKHIIVDSLRAPEKTIKNENSKIGILSNSRSCELTLPGPLQGSPMAFKAFQKIPRSPFQDFCPPLSPWGLVTRGVQGRGQGGVKSR